MWVFEHHDRCSDIVTGEIWTSRLFGKPIPVVLQEIQQQPEIEGIIVTKENEVIASKGIQARLLR